VAQESGPRLGAEVTLTDSHAEPVLLLVENREDAYDLCFCLDNAPGGIEALAQAWRARRIEPLVASALTHLRDKFATVSSYGPRQVAIFYEAKSREEQERHSRRGYELVARFLELIGQG